MTTTSELPSLLREYAAVEKHSPYAAEAMREAADEIERLQAIVDRQHSALVVAGFECDELGDCDLHVLALDVAEENEREDGEATDDDYAEAYMRAVERLRASVAKTADCLREVWNESDELAERAEVVE